MSQKLLATTGVLLALFATPFAAVTAEESVIIDLTTGEPVKLITPNWEAKNIENRPIVCEGHYWSSTARTYLSNAMTIYYHSPLETEGTVIAEQVFKSHRVNANARKSSTWNLTNGEYTGPGLFARKPTVEIVSTAGGFKNATRVWFSDTGYQLCTAFPPSGTFVPTGNLPDCIDTPPIGDGWGWDGDDSCKILKDDELGFGQCEVHYDNLPIGDCVDVEPVGDGYGWNGVYSCEI